MIRKHVLFTKQVPVTAYVGSSKNLKDLQNRILKDVRKGEVSAVAYVGKIRTLQGVPLITPLGPYSRIMLRVLRQSYGGGQFDMKEVQGYLAHKKQPPSRTPR